MRFWDTSAIIPLLCRHEYSITSKQYFSENHNLVVARATIVEIHSIFTRLIRDKRLKKAGHAEALKILNHISSTWIVVAPIDRVFELASQLTYSHSLTSADANQLASALVWTRETPIDKDFICYDSRLAKAANACGFNALSY